MINFSRVKGILLQELFITRKSLEIFFDIPFFAFTSILLVGFIASYISGSIGQIGAQYLVLGMILWECLRVTQYTMSVNVLWEVWSRNLSNIFISPITIFEYFLALILSTIIKILVLNVFLSIISFYMFDFNVLKVGIATLSLVLINLLIFGWTTGILILGLIFRFGTRIQSLAWGIIFLFQPFTAALYPVTILPKPIQTFAFFFPPTYVFEVARQSLSNQSINWSYINTAFILNIIYFSISIFVFAHLFKKSKDTGQFARNEG
ncbi:MAG: hypothetical protein AABX29_09210 [Nanoarchaeota archaeon]